MSCPAPLLILNGINSNSSTERIFFSESRLPARAAAWSCLYSLGEMEPLSLLPVCGLSFLFTIFLFCSLRIRTDEASFLRARFLFFAFLLRCSSKCPHRFGPLWPRCHPFVFCVQAVFVCRPPVVLFLFLCESSLDLLPRDFTLCLGAFRLFLGGRLRPFPSLSFFFSGPRAPPGAFNPRFFFFSPPTARCHRSGWRRLSFFQWILFLPRLIRRRHFALFCGERFMVFLMTRHITLEFPFSPIIEQRSFIFSFRSRGASVATLDTLPFSRDFRSPTRKFSWDGLSVSRRSALPFLTRCFVLCLPTRHSMALFFESPAPICGTQATPWRHRSDHCRSTAILPPLCFFRRALHTLSFGVNLVSRSSPRLPPPTKRRGSSALHD